MVTAIHREIEEDVVALELATVKSRIGQLTEQLSSKQLEVSHLERLPTSTFLKDFTSKYLLHNLCTHDLIFVLLDSRLTDSISD